VKSTLGGKMPYKRRCRWSRKASTENSMVSNWINVKTYKLTERIFIGTNNHSIWGGGGGGGAKYHWLFSSRHIQLRVQQRVVAVFSGSTSNNWRRMPIHICANHALKSLGDYCWRFLFLQFADTFSLVFRQFGGLLDMSSRLYWVVHFLGIS